LAARSTRPQRPAAPRSAPLACPGPAGPPPRRPVGAVPEGVGLRDRRPVAGATRTRDPAAPARRVLAPGRAAPGRAGPGRATVTTFIHFIPVLVTVDVEPVDCDRQHAVRRAGAGPHGAGPHGAGPCGARATVAGPGASAPAPPRSVVCRATAALTGTPTAS